VPELPEVESVREALSDLVGSWFVPGDAPKYSRYAGAGEAAGVLKDARRRGKWLILQFDGSAGGKCELVAHLGMTGKFLVARAPLEIAHLHATWTITRPDGEEHWLGYVDPRRFGRLDAVVPGRYDTIGALASLGPEATDPTASEEALLAARGSRRSIKSVLLDQRAVAGVGNIYCDEALFASKIHPERAIGNLTEDECRDLARNLAQILLESIQAGGTTFRDYRKPDGSRGENVSNLRCYGRAGLPCDRCGTMLHGSTIAGRRSTHCPGCQK
jgi:formamidopyrimidine-DNA glycosylase